MKKEYIARAVVLVLVFGAAVVLIAARWRNEADVVVVHAAMPDRGGWYPLNLSAKLNEPLHLRLVSDDVLHGFAIGQSGLDPIDLYPGKPTQITLNFERPGTYTYYCTRWCGPDHWRMRGTITVEPDSSLPIQDESTKPLYLDLGIDLDEPHKLPNLELKALPSAERGRELGVSLPASYLSRQYYLSHTPYQAWQDLRSEPLSENLNDSQVWDLVSVIWSSGATKLSLKEGEELYSQNCAVCHGSDGGGAGIFAPTPSAAPGADAAGNDVVSPPDFKDPGDIFGASPALLQGKILRGGMGTGMPSWGKIFTTDQTWALTDYLWSFSIQDLKE